MTCHDCHDCHECDGPCGYPADGTVLVSKCLYLSFSPAVLTNLYTNNKKIIC